MALLAAGAKLMAMLVVGEEMVAVSEVGVHWWLSAGAMDAILICFPKLGK